MTADAGYFSAGNVAACETRKVPALIAVSRESTKDKKPTRDTPASKARQAMATKLGTVQGRATYARRKAIVEPPFGQIKQARGFRRFSFRGQASVSAEWSLVCLTHNLLKLFRAPRKARKA